MMSSANGEAAMSADEGRFSRGVDEFNRGEFFAAHESWETIWLEAAGRDKVFLQGIIQLAAAFHQWKRGNARGTLALLGRGIEKLGGFSGSYRGVRVDWLREQADAWRRALGEGAAEPGETPRIELG
jgi:predicted metal-dependent hydrolase